MTYLLILRKSNNHFSAVGSWQGPLSLLNRYNKCVLSPSFYSVLENIHFILLASQRIPLLCQGLPS